MAETQRKFWQGLWKNRVAEDFSTYLPGYVEKSDPVVELFRRWGIRTVCDAACGYGAYSLLLLSNGFSVEGFDSAPQSVAIAKKLLASYGYDVSGYWTADVLHPGCSKEYDAVTARSVLDHLYVEETKRGLAELLRLTRRGGLLAVSFDGPEEVDGPHRVEADGSILYTGGRREGMVIHIYTDEELKELLSPYKVVLAYTNEEGERFFVVENEG